MGLTFFDFDNVANLDLVLANGFPDIWWRSFPTRLLTESLCCCFITRAERSRPSASREVRFLATQFAAGVINNDRILEVLISVNDGAPVLLRNNIGKQSHWIGVNLIGRKSNLDTIGAHVTYQAGDQARG